MTNTQLFLSIGIPILFNGLLIQMLNNHMHKLSDLQGKLFVERLKNMEDVIDGAAQAYWDQTEYRSVVRAGIFRWWLRLHEKGGKVNEMGCHHKQEGFVDEYIAAAGIADDKKGPLFRAAIGRMGKLSDRPMSRVDA